MNHASVLHVPRPVHRDARSRLLPVPAATVAVTLAGALLAAGPASAAPPANLVTDAVDADSPVHHWRLDEGGAAAVDRARSSDLAVPASAVRGVPGATADADAATAFAGGPAVAGGSSARAQGPRSFSVEVWLRTTTSSGGKIVGFEDTTGGRSDHYDRHVWMLDDGRVAFGVWDGTAQVVQSPGPLNDGAWHQVVATYDTGVMRLFVDGAGVGARSGVLRAEPFAGSWRVGGGRLAGWPGAPTSESFTGDLDDVAVYGAPLSLDRVSAHLAAAGGATPAPPGQPDQPGQPGEPRRSDFGSYRPSSATAGSYGTLEPYGGDLTITERGQVVEGLDISGVLRIKADGVTVRRSVVRGGDRGPGYRGAVLMALAGDQRGAVIEDVTVRPSHPVVGMNAVQLSSATLLRSDVSNATDGIVVYGDDVTLAGNHVHDLVHYGDDPAQRDGSHDDAVQVEGGSRTTIVGNSLSGGHNAGIQVTQNYARVDGLVIDRNHLGGGYLTLNTSEKGRGAYSGFRVTGNRFQGDQRNRYGVQAAVTPGTRSAATMTGNVIDGTGLPIRVVDAGS